MLYLKKKTTGPKDERSEGGERPKPQVLSPQSCARGQFHPLHLTPHTHVNGRRGSKTTNRVRQAVRGSRHRMVLGSRHRIVCGGRGRIVRGGRHGIDLYVWYRVDCGGRRPAVDYPRTCRPSDGRTSQRRSTDDWKTGSATVRETDTHALSDNNT